MDGYCYLEKLNADHAEALTQVLSAIIRTGLVALRAD